MYKYMDQTIGCKFREAVFVPFGLNDHEHCIMCWKKFSDREGDLHKGLVTEDIPSEGDYWVCYDCFDENKDEYEWSQGEEL